MVHKPHQWLTSFHPHAWFYILCARANNSTLTHTHTRDLLQLGCTVSAVLTTSTLCKHICLFSPPSSVKFGPGRQVGGATGVLLSPWQPPLTPPYASPSVPPIYQLGFSEAYGMWVKAHRSLLRPYVRAHLWCRPDSCGTRLIRTGLRVVFVEFQPCSYFSTSLKRCWCLQARCGRRFHNTPLVATGRLFLLTLSLSPLTGHLQWPKACRAPVVTGKTLKPLKFSSVLQTTLTSSSQS